MGQERILPVVALQAGFGRVLLDVLGVEGVCVLLNWLLGLFRSQRRLLFGHDSFNPSRVSLVLWCWLQRAGLRNTIGALIITIGLLYYNYNQEP